jgi:hypothetical protein
MTKQIWNALQPVRGAIHGWAFANARGLDGRISAARVAIAKLPEPLKPHGEALLQPLLETRAKLGA